ncbi:MAG: enoyl-CoA hydratase-related protein [Acidimicrobiales bacterium]|nr:enoyl-CoA hydratase-related protein [Acidimicrobiales bacterium]
MSAHPAKPYPIDVDGLEIVTHHDRGVLELTIDRPDRRNAVTDDIVQALIGAIEAAGSDDEVRVVRLDGRGDHFCSGFDLAGRAKPDGPLRAGETQRRMRWQVDELIPAMLETQTPIVASVRGTAMGLGLAMALAADFAIVADDARLSSPFVRSGFTPDSGSSWLLPRLVGVARAKDMLLLGTTIDGATAAGWGMVHTAVPAGDVGAATDALVERLATSATVAVGLAKSLVHRSLTADLDRHLADEAMAIELSSRSADFAEWSRARREKRDPEFDGR